MKQEPKNKKSITPRPNIMWLWGLIGAGIIFTSLFLGDSNTPIDTQWSTVRELASKGAVESITVIKDKEKANIYLTESAIDSLQKSEQMPLSRVHKGDEPQLTYEIPSVDGIREDVAMIQDQYNVYIPLKFTDEGGGWQGIFISALPWIVMIGIWMLLMRNLSRGAGGGGNGGIMNVGKARAQMFDKDSAKRITFKDVAGLEEAKIEVMEIVDFLKNSTKYQELGAKIPKGALLAGPPGTGKTLLAKAVAGEAEVPFLSISGSDFVEMFVGVGASRVRDLFEQAKKKAPCIVFIDEIDAIGRARGRNSGFSGNDERENTLNQLLTEMDGFQTNAGVIVLAATNRIDILDKALMRAGRFDRQIEVGLPDITEREEIFNVHLRKLKLAPNLDRSFLARQTPGFSGADIANICNEAALIAARHSKKEIEQEDFLAAVDRIVGGLERKNKVMTIQEKRITAYHEAGHATVSWLLEYANPLVKVTIIPRGKSLGAAWYLPQERVMSTREQMIEQMASTLGGRVAEQVVFGHLATGAANDLERVTKEAYAMVTYYGMSDKVGAVNYYDSTGNYDSGFTKPYSEQTAQLLDSEAKAIIAEASDLATTIVKENLDKMTELAELLLEREVVFTEDVEKIFGKRKGCTEPAAEVEQAEVVAEESTPKAE